VPLLLFTPLVHSVTLLESGGRDMAVLNLRDVPEELMIDLKVSAARNQMTLKEWCVFLLSHNCSEIKEAKKGKK
jgi:hypothetical protein